MIPQAGVRGTPGIGTKLQKLCEGSVKLRDQLIVILRAVHDEGGIAVSEVRHRYDVALWGKAFCLAVRSAAVLSVVRAGTGKEPVSSGRA